MTIDQSLGVSTASQSSLWGSSHEPHD